MADRLPFPDQKIEDARNMAIFAHGDQKYGDAPYVRHLDEVAQLCEQHGTKSVIVAFLHDTLEDTPLSPGAIEETFGGEIRKLVEVITDPPGRNRRERKAASYAKLASVAVNSPMSIALIVKAADRLANVRACALNKPDLFEMYRKEHATFEVAVRRSGLNDALMDELSAIFMAYGGGR